MPLAEEEVSGIALFIPEIYDIVWSLVVLIVIAVGVLCGDHAEVPGRVR